jgi:hypothetical protein
MSCLLDELDPAVAEVLVGAAMSLLPLTPGQKVLCTKRQSQECMSKSVPTSPQPGTAVLPGVKPGPPKSIAEKISANRTVWLICKVGRYVG